MAKPIHLCIPVLRRYDLLRRLLLSVKLSARQPDQVVIVDNGRDWSAIAGAIAGTLAADRFTVETPAEPAGVAQSWNWFIGHVPEERIIANDDMWFAPQSIDVLAETPGDLVMGFGFSCFLIRDSCVEKIGPFDEGISPGYGYFEDCDYAERIREASWSGVPIVMTDSQGSGLVHGDGKDGSSTFRAGTPDQIVEHWRRYHVARLNFVRKHGAEPQVLEARWAERYAQRKARESAPA